MLERQGNIWDHVSEYDAVVITTNGFVKKNGEAVIGSGIALEAKNRFPWFALALGKLLKAYGNHVFMVEHPEYWLHEPLLITMPTKPEYGPNKIPGWKAKSDIMLIMFSLGQLVRLVDEIGINRILMPRPGCGSGGLKWEDVKPIIKPYLDDRFTIMSYE